MLETSARRPSAPGLRPHGGWSSRPLGLLAAVLLLAACGGQTGPEPESVPTSVTELGAEPVEVPRIEFCELVEEGAVTAALGGEATSGSSYGNGDEVDLPLLDEPDVVHEIGCSWERAEDASARAWVFARPVTPEFAERLVRLTDTEGCTTTRTPAYAKPSVLRTCQTTSEGTQQVRRAGLFGQTWLTCEVNAQGDLAELEARTDQWCIAVVNALNTEG